MKTKGPALLPIFRSQHQVELLTWLYLHPAEQFSLSDLAARLGVSVATMHREADRLGEASLVIEDRIGRSRLISANPGHPSAAELGALLERTFGPRHVVNEEFTGAAGVHLVVIFGSWAARHHGEYGRAPNDVDVLVIGDAIARGDIYKAADRAQERLGIPVNPVIRTRSQWEEPSDALVNQIKARPYLAL